MIVSTLVALCNRGGYRRSKLDYLWADGESPRNQHDVRALGRLARSRFRQGARHRQRLLRQVPGGQAGSGLADDAGHRAPVGCADLGVAEPVVPAGIRVRPVVVGSIGVYAMHQFGDVSLHVKGATVLANVLGGLIFGVGMVVLGYGPDHRNLLQPSHRRRGVQEYQEPSTPGVGVYN